jgi:hypothetical protein
VVIHVSRDVLCIIKRCAILQVETEQAFDACQPATGGLKRDPRCSIVARLALAECTEAEIATITGHSLRDVRSILDAHYLHRDPALAESAIRKLERGTKTPN